MYIHHCTVTHMNIRKESKRSVLPSPNRSRPLTAPGSNQLVEPLDAPGPGHARYQAPQRCTMICRERLTIPRFGRQSWNSLKPVQVDKGFTPNASGRHLKGKNNIASWVLKVDVLCVWKLNRSLTWGRERAYVIYVPTWQFPPIAWETSLKTLKTFLLSSHLQQASIRSTSTLCIYL